ncbi:MAG: YciI family protein [Cyclobacteriaceae bacterium]|nr:YciI family protein [Cyclobacteriaceae bacterium]
MKSISIFLLSLVLHQGLAQEHKHIFVFLNNKLDKTELPKEELDKLMEGHLNNIQRLVKEGKMLVAGPFDGGGGIFIFNSSSMDSVRLWLATDPGIQAERWELELFPYLPRVGSVCVADANAEMVTYTFIRYLADITKFNVQKAGETFKKHDDFLKQIIKTGNVVTEGIFPPRDGGILVMKGDVDAKLIESDPAMMDALFSIEYKKLWVMKGSFCEP